jgi:gas vesicle protein GvpK
MALKRPARRAKPRASTARNSPKRAPARVPEKRRKPRLQPQTLPEPSPLASLEVQEIESLRAELDRLASSSSPPRWNADPEDVRRSVAKLVLTLVEFIRQVLERQAIRRMEAGTLTGEQTESVGLALMRLEETVRDLGAQFGLEPGDLNLDLGPIGKLM